MVHLINVVIHFTTTVKMVVEILSSHYNRTNVTEIPVPTVIMSEGLPAAVLSDAQGL